MNAKSGRNILARFNLLLKQLSTTSSKIFKKKQSTPPNYISDVLKWKTGQNANIVPVLKLQQKLLLPQNVARKDLRISNVLSGTIANVNAIIFGFQYIYSTSNGRSHITSLESYLLLDIYPRNVPHFWFSERTWADQAMLKKELVTGILSTNLLIQGPDLPAIRTIFDQDMVKYYEDNLHVQLRGNDRWVLIRLKDKKHRPVRSKEQVLDFIAEGKYFLNRLSKSLS